MLRVRGSVVARSLAFLLGVAAVATKSVQGDGPKPVGALFITVRDSLTNRPLEANVVLIRTSGGITDQRGRLWLGSIPEGRHLLSCKAIAYHAKEDTIEVHANRCDSIVVRLRRYKHVEADGDLIRVWD